MSLKRVSNIYPIARCNEASFRLGKISHPVQRYSNLAGTTYYEVRSANHSLHTFELKLIPVKENRQPFGKAVPSQIDIFG